MLPPWAALKIHVHVSLEALGQNFVHVCLCQHLTLLHVSHAQFFALYLKSCRI